MEVDGIDRTGPISIPNTGSGSAFQFVTVNDIWFDAGKHVFRVVIDGSGGGKGNFDYFTINPYFPPQVAILSGGKLTSAAMAAGRGITASAGASTDV